MACFYNERCRRARHGFFNPKHSGDPDKSAFVLFEKRTPPSILAVTASIPAQTAPRLRPERDPLVVAEDEHSMVVDKPALMAAHPSKPGDGATLWHWLQNLLAYECVTGGQVSLINRLDRETSGLTLVAKTRGAARSLCRQMESHRIAKTYLALVHGWPAQEAWHVDAPLCRKGSHEPSAIWLKQTIHPRGAPARTDFTRLHLFERQVEAGLLPFALVQARPVTGRMHQIRVHLANAGHPIVGDKIYGHDETCYLDFIQSGWTPELESRLILPRHALHAHALTLLDSAQTWTAPLPADMRRFLPEDYSC
jgi:23S rRNA pseudouridine1911/1915/1917 synthase